MNRIKPEVDVVMDVLRAVTEAQPASVFAQSLLQQYQERGGLSKKQLQGLLGKASKIDSIPASKLATLEAIILKKPTRYRSELPSIPPAAEPRDEKVGTTISAILAKYPQHKRVLFFKSRFDNGETLSPAELAELQKFSKLLDK